VAWRVARSRLPGPVKRELLMDFDRLLALDLLARPRAEAVPREVDELAQQRRELRLKGSYAEADTIRETLHGMGYEVRDTREGTTLAPAPAWAAGDATISSSGDVDSLLEEPEVEDFTISIVARQGCEELQRCLDSVLRWSRLYPVQVIVVDNGLEEGCGSSLDELASRDERVRIFHADHFLGAAAGRNVTLRQARGRYVVMLDTSVELKGDIFTPLRRLLEDPGVGIAGRWGVVSDDLRSFDEAGASGEVDAVEGYLMAFRRELLREAGLLDEKYRFYRHLDLDFSLAARTRGYRAVIDAALPVARHEHIDWAQTPVEERDRLSKRNFYRFLRKWGERKDLLVAQAR